MGSSAFCLGLLAEVSVLSQSYGQNPHMHSPLKGLILNIREKVLLHFTSCHRQGLQEQVSGIRAMGHLAKRRLVIWVLRFTKPVWVHPPLKGLLLFRCSISSVF